MSIITILVASAAALLLAALGLYAFSRWLQRREPYRSFMQLRLAQKVSFFRRLYADSRVPWYVKLVPIAMAHLFVGLAGAFRGQMPDSSAVTGGFVVAEVLMVIALVLYARRSRLAAAFIGWFCLSYGLFAAFVGSMALADIWL